MVKKSAAVLLGLLCVLWLSGCGTEAVEVVEIAQEPYVRAEYAVATVKKGSLTPQITAVLTQDRTQEKSYGVVSYDFSVEKLCVSVGDCVKQGEVLVRFDAKEITETLQQYEEVLAANDLLIDHYTRMMEIDDTQDYHEDITSLQKDNEIAQLYIEECREKLKNYQIRAEMGGVVTQIDEELIKGRIGRLDSLITVVSGTGNYIAKVEDDSMFETGAVYQAQSAGGTYRMKLKKRKGGRLVFEALDDMSAWKESDKLTVTVQGATRLDCIYVDEKAVGSCEAGSYVFVPDKDGYRDIIWVETGETVSGHRIIEQGLSEGQQVMIPE